MGYTGKERKFPSSVRLISTTDLEGKITYANQEFCEVAGYQLDELVGKPHSLVRHPDMPPEAFADLWRYAKEDKAWMGIVKNLCSDGDYYWVQAYVTPLYDEKGVKVGYQSVRTRPSDEQIERAGKIYQKINANARLKIRSRSASASILVAAVAGSLLGLALLLLPVSPLYVALGQALVFAVMLLIIWQNTRSFKMLADMGGKIYPNKLAQYVMSPYMNEVGAAELSNLMMQARLRTVTGRVEDSVGTLTTFVDQTHMALEQTAQGVEKQNVETDMLASAATQMSATAHEIAENTSQTSKATQDAASLAREGKEIVEGMISGIRDLVGEVSLAGDSSNELKSKAAAVEQVIEIINEIAEQTNLLALNAAIEAARAGEQGRGFSVVADEVRVLAKRTRESTEEIRTTIEAIQQQVGSTVDAMQRCSLNAQENIQRAERVGSSFDQVNTAMLDITDRSTQVAAASEQQSAVADEVSRNIENIRQVSLQNSEIAQRTHRSAADLTGLVCDLKSMIKAI